MLVDRGDVRDHRLGDFERRDFTGVDRARDLARRKREPDPSLGLGDDLGNAEKAVLRLRRAGHDGIVRRGTARASSGRMTLRDSITCAVAATSEVSSCLRSSTCSSSVFELGAVALDLFIAEREARQPRDPAHVDPFRGHNPES